MKDSFAYQFAILIIVILVLVAIKFGDSFVKKRDEYVSNKDLENLIYFLITSTGQKDRVSSKSKDIFYLNDGTKCLELGYRGGNALIEVEFFDDEKCLFLLGEKSPLNLMMNKDWHNFKHTKNKSFVENSDDLMFELMGYL